MRFAQIFQWDVDFVLDIRPGDEFSIVFESLYLNGEKVEDGDILAATFVNQGKTFEALALRPRMSPRVFYTRWKKHEEGLFKSSSRVLELALTSTRSDVIRFSRQ